MSWWSGGPAAQCVVGEAGGDRWRRDLPQPARIVPGVGVGAVSGEVAGIVVGESLRAHLGQAVALSVVAVCGGDAVLGDGRPVAQGIVGV